MIKIDNVNFGYSNNGELFNNLSLDILPGNVYGLLGKNGAGKSTLLKLISGLLYTDSGKITYNDIDVANREPRILSDIFMIPEEFHIPELSITSYINHFGGFYPKFDNNVMDNLISEFEIESRKKIHNLSYGQKKKFLIAFAIATNCSVVLMDEPTNGLDIPSKSKFRKIIASSASEDRSFIISTHQVRDLENLIDPIIMIENGKIIFNQSIESISNGLSFIKSDQKPMNGNKIFYSEPVFGGEFYVTERVDNESPIDFELLFNAVLSNTNDIVSHLS